MSDSGFQNRTSAELNQIEHVCSGCHHVWTGDLRGAELCGDCWRKGQGVILGSVAGLARDCQECFEDGCAETRRELEQVREVYQCDLKIASERVLTLELESQQLRKIGHPTHENLRMTFTDEVIRAIGALARQQNVCREQAGQMVFVTGMEAAREYIVEHVQLASPAPSPVSAPSEGPDWLTAQKAPPPPVLTFCVSCGVNVNVDEDGCCVACGCDAMPSQAAIQSLLALLSPAPSTGMSTTYVEGAQKTLVEARNTVMSAIVALRGGHSAVMDTCDEAMAELDIAITRAFVPPPQEATASQASQNTKHMENIPEFYEPTFWVAGTGHGWAVMHRYHGHKVALCISSEKIARTRANTLNELFDDIAGQSTAPSKWLPIETADTDDGEVILFDPKYPQSVVCGEWDSELEEHGGQCWRSADSISDRLQPTHWMPLPLPPVPLSGERE